MECLVSFVLLLVFLLLLFFLWREVKVATPTFEQLLGLFRESPSRTEKTFWGLIIFARSRFGFGSIFVPVSCAGFACVATICSDLNLPLVRQLLLDFYAFLERVLARPDR